MKKYNFIQKEYKYNSLSDERIDFSSMVTYHHCNRIQTWRWGTKPEDAIYESFYQET
jgi:hypothetical protein